MRAAALAVFALLALAPGCRRRAHSGRRVARHATSPRSVLQVAPARGPTYELGGGRFVSGALRVEGPMRANPPHPAAALISAEATGATWRFVSADGTVFDAPSFLGPLRVVGHQDGADLLAAQGFRYRPGVTDGGAPAVREAESELLRLLPEHERAPLPLPDEAWAAAARTDGAVDVLRGDQVLRYDPVTLRVTARHEAPGSACTLHRAFLGTRAVCTHAGWARAVFAEERRWEALRDELHAQPVGDVAFDDRTPVWAVGAPCAEAAAPQGNRVCVYQSDGTRTDLTLPFDGAPVAAHDGAVLFVEALREAPQSDAAIWRRGRLQRITLPTTPAAARGARWEGDALTMIEGVTLVRVWLRGDRPGNVLRLPGPPGTRAMVAGDGAVFALGADRAWRLLGERFVPQPVAWEGLREGRDLSAGEGFCAGPWCRLSDALWWSARGVRSSSALSHDHAGRGARAP
ncbi:MAG: hypothetical protein R3A48_03760 [Polyangiales bacterium]